MAGKGMTFGEAVQNPATRLGADAVALKAQREKVIGEWMALGYSREEAYQAALFGCETAPLGRQV